MTARLCRMVEFLQWGMASPQRLRWLFTENPIYFITTCTYRRRPILDRPEVHEAFIQFGLHAIEQGVWVGRYVIMPEHIHLFAGFGPESKSLSLWMKSLKNTISKTLKTATFPGPHWQKGFFDRVIRSGESYEQKWLYVRDNPVRAELVRSAEDWPYAGEIAELPFEDRAVIDRAYRRKVPGGHRSARFFYVRRMGSL